MRTTVELHVVKLLSLATHVVTVAVEEFRFLWTSVFNFQDCLVVVVVDQTLVAVVADATLVAVADVTPDVVADATLVAVLVVTPDVAVDATAVAVADTFLPVAVAMAAALVDADTATILVADAEDCSSVVVADCSVV